MMDLNALPHYQDEMPIKNASPAASSPATSSLALRFSSAQEQLLSMAIDNKNLQEIAEAAAAFLERYYPDCLALIAFSSTCEALACHNQHLNSDIFAPFSLKAPSPLSQSFTRGDRIEVENLASHPAWQDHALRAGALGFFSVFSAPLTHQTTRSGAFAIYWRKPKKVNEEEKQDLLEFASFLAKIPRILSAGEKMNAEQDRFSELACTIPGVVYQRRLYKDGTIRYTYVSAGAKDIFGIDAETILTNPEALFNHYSPEYRAKFRQNLIEASKEMRIWDVEAEILRPDGEIRYTHAIAHPRKEADGSVLWTGIILDASRMKKAELAAAAAETKTREAIVESFSQGLLLFDQNGRLIVHNSHFIALHPGIKDITKPGVDYVDILKAELNDDRINHGIESDMEEELNERLSKYFSHSSSVYERKIGHDRWVMINENPTSTGGRVVLYTDVTEIKRREKHIEHIAHHDALTGLPNRVLFRKKLEDSLNQAQTTGKDVAVIFVDLDRFKAVNDTLGHPVGDALLQVVGERIQETLCPSDSAARLGGDEFAIIVIEDTTSENLNALAWRLIDVLSRPCEIAGHSVVVGASIGISMGHEGASSADELLKSADLALYRAKSDGKGTFRFFETEMDAIAQRRRLLEMDLRSAIALGQLKVHYQPQVDVFTAQMVGAEALLRWHHPERGNVSPSDFIPLAEETGLITEIGPWVLRQACKDAIKWPHATRVAVNVSPAQFQNGGFVDIVRDTLAESGLKPSRLELEITETVLLRDTESNLKTLWALKNLGVRISMDDFGTGYSSLGNLRSFPFDKIKIDRSFINDLKSRTDAAAIIRAVLSLGRSLGITTTAEGVETRDQLTYLRAEGCSEVQGFYYSEARSPADIQELLDSSQNGIISPR